MCHGNNRGILHKIVNAKYRVTGDVPSVTRTVNSIQPTTFKGKALKRTAQTANRIAHDTVNTVVHTGLAAETAAIRTADDVSREIVDQARRKYTREAVDDYHRGTFAALRIGADAVKGTKRHFKLKKQYRLEKAKYRLKKADNQLFQVEKYQPEKRKAVKRLRKNKADFKEQKAVPEESRKQTDTPKPAIPPRPQPSPEAVSYKHLCEIYQKLQEQNKAIFALEKQRSDLEIELSDSKGIFKAKRRSELSTEIAGLEERIARMKVRLSHIVKEYGYQNAEAFYKAFHKSETAYGDYQDSLKNWKQRYGEKPQSLHDRLKSKKQDIRERELTRPYSPPNRGRSR